MIVAPATTSTSATGLSYFGTSLALKSACSYAASTSVPGLSKTSSGGDINVNGSAGGGGAYQLGGTGASTLFGAGGAGASGSVGLDATGYGAGGGGGSNTPNTGGLGTQGIIVITEYYNIN